MREDMIVIAIKLLLLWVNVIVTTLLAIFCPVWMCLPAQSTSKQHSDAIGNYT
ncbi:hypothetical protein ARMSODRAFT_955986 [Armillaria solidipes]|uniref:Uncharacterized protein n=1 Tax=Armillaria solidipes TaxID=1076256 RepID=A0A2H3BU03_9AGAR|nr:hypothetical protein ARMSODRAFT_955986 [Armillaria solidipes]